MNNLTLKEEFREIQEISENIKKGLLNVIDTYKEKQ